jgi:hypothetical protein
MSKVGIGILESALERAKSIRKNRIQDRDFYINGLKKFNDSVIESEKEIAEIESAIEKLKGR